MHPEQLGLWLKKIRKYSGMTQMQAARSLGVSQGQISRYERGISRITADSLMHLLHIYNQPHLLELGAGALSAFQLARRITLEADGDANSELRSLIGHILDAWEAAVRH